MRWWVCVGVLLLVTACSLPAREQPVETSSLSLVGYLWLVHNGEADAFCSATRIGPRHVLSVEHCGASVVGAAGEIRQGMKLFFGEHKDARAAETQLQGENPQEVTPRIAIREVVLLKQGPDSKGEGVALFALEEETGWSIQQQVVIQDPLSALGAGTGKAPAKASGYGFGCDVRQEDCCDARFSKVCQDKRWGRQKSQHLFPVAWGRDMLWTLLQPGDLLCAGDSGVGMRLESEKDTLALAAVYSGSYLVYRDAYQGTLWQTRPRICAAFSWAQDSQESRQGFYYSWHVRLCPFADRLKELVPGLRAQCEDRQICSTMPPAPSQTSSQAWQRLQEQIEQRRTCTNAP